MTYQLKRVFDHVKHLTAENTKLIAMFKSAGGKHNNTFGAENRNCGNDQNDYEQKYDTMGYCWTHGFKCVW